MEIGPDPVDMMVGFSHYEGGKAATRHLVDAGYRRVAFIGARMDPRSRRRLAGYRAAMEEAGLFDERLVTITARPSSVTTGSELFREALAKAPALDAAFCNNDDMALGALFECHRQGRAVPSEIGIAGFNDLEMMQVACPSITSLRTYRYEMGHRAIAMALDAVAGRRPVEPVVDLGFELIVRDSTRR
jgi:LacI family gluconate utilization system Gnt-I transcriptional repressor